MAEYPPYLIPHSDYGDPECCGLVFAIARDSSVAVFQCNECAAIVTTVPLAAVEAMVEQIPEIRRTRARDI
jgi:hypothetical protein